MKGDSQSGSDPSRKYSAMTLSPLALSSRRWPVSRSRSGVERKSRSASTIRPSDNAMPAAATRPEIVVLDFIDEAAGPAEAEKPRKRRTRGGDSAMTGDDLGTDGKMAV